MPKARATSSNRQLPTRESPRKRKRVEADIEIEVTGAPNGSGVPIQVVEEKLINTTPTKRSKKVHSTSVKLERPTESHDPEPLESESRPQAAKFTPNAKAKSSNRKAQEHHIVDSEVVHDLNGEKGRPPKSAIASPLSKNDEVETVDEISKKQPRKRKTKEEKEAESMPLAPRTTGLKMFVGAHVSIAKGVENAVTNALHIGGNAFALFLKSQRKWDNPALKDENRDAFLKQCTHQKYDSKSHVVPHGSYLVNLATPDMDKAKQSYDTFLDDLRRCEALGIKYYNFHPGSTNQQPLAEAIGRLSANLNRALSETSTVVPLLENMSGGGSVIGSRFTDLRDIIAGIKPEFRSRIGICIDTCHTLAAGYDLRTPEAFAKTFQELDDVVGLRYLKAMHINDSKAPLGSKRDLHQNIGLGFLGLRAFHNVMNDIRLQNIPLILETPSEHPDPKDPTGKKTIEDKQVWATEIKLLESLIGMDPASEVFKKLEADLSEKGRAEREKMEASINTRDEKARKKAEKGQKSLADMLVTKTSKGRKKLQQKDTGSSSELSDVGESDA